MILRSPTANETTLTPGSSPGQALSLSPFDKAQGRRWNGRGDFSMQRAQIFSYPRPLAGEGRVRVISASAQRTISKERFASVPGWFRMFARLSWTVTAQVTDPSPRLTGFALETIKVKPYAPVTFTSPFGSIRCSPGSASACHSSPRTRTMPRGSSHS
jgi:hypothetical protein